MPTAEKTNLLIKVAYKFDVMERLSFEHDESCKVYIKFPLMALKYRSKDGAKKKLQFAFDSHQEFDKCIECFKMWEVDIRDLKADGSQVGSQLESELDSFLGSQIAIHQDYRLSSQQENNYSTNTTQDEYNSQDLTDLLTQYLPAPSEGSSNGISTEGKSIEELAAYLLDNLKDREFIQMVSHRRIAERIHYIN